MDNFDPLLVYMKAFCRKALNEFAGALLRPHGEGMSVMMEMGMSLDDIFEAAKEAGRKPVEDGGMSAETLSIVSRELMPMGDVCAKCQSVFPAGAGRFRKSETPFRSKVCQNPRPAALYPDLLSCKFNF